MASSSSPNSSRWLRTKPRTRYTELGAMNTELLDKTSDEFCCRLALEHIHPQFNKPMFKSPGDIVSGLTGKEFNINYIQHNGLSMPVKFGSGEREDLGIKLPQGDITPELVAQLVGLNRSIVAMSVKTQDSNVNMKLKDWADYFESTELREKKGVLNLISLEFSGTPLASQVVSPSVVREIDWIDRAWQPITKTSKKKAYSTTSKFKHKGAGSDTFGRPKVQKYCLMSAAGSFTDFHIDFGGTSVWYHLVKGRKVFLLAPPSREVLEAFQQFTWDSAAYLPDLLPPSTFTHCTLNAGETLFIPSGWVHAVYTPVDSLVFGGNFLHSFSVKAQVDVMLLEERTFVRAAMRFPLANELLWRMALIVVCEMSSTQRPISGDAADGDDSGLAQWLGGEVELASMRVHLSKLLERTEAPDWVLDPKVVLNCFREMLKIKKGVKKGSVDRREAVMDEIRDGGVDLETVPVKFDALQLPMSATVLDEPKKHELWYLKTVKLNPPEELKLRKAATAQWSEAYDKVLSINATNKNNNYNKKKFSKKKKAAKEGAMEEMLPDVLEVGQLVRAKFKRSAMFYPGVVVAVVSEETSGGSKSKGWLRDEYSVAFEDGDFDPKVRREFMKGRLLNDAWILKRMEVMKNLDDHRIANQKKQSKKRLKAEQQCPFAHPTQTIEEKGVKRHRAMLNPLLNRQKEEFGRLLDSVIRERPNISEQSVALNGAWEECHSMLHSQMTHLKSMSHPICGLLPPNGSAVLKTMQEQRSGNNEGDGSSQTGPPMTPTEMESHQRTLAIVQDISAR